MSSVECHPVSTRFPCLQCQNSYELLLCTQCHWPNERSLANAECPSIAFFFSNVSRNGQSAERERAIAEVERRSVSQ